MIIYFEDENCMVSSEDSTMFIHISVITLHLDSELVTFGKFILLVEILFRILQLLKFVHFVKIEVLTKANT